MINTDMKNIGSDGNCPYCHKKVSGYKATKIDYGTPIRACPKCGQDYYDRRFFEPAVSGFVKGETNAKNSLKTALYAAICFAICLAVNWLEVRESGEYYVYLAIMQFVALIVIIVAIIDAIRISAGAKRKKLDFLMWESDERLKNLEYAVFLKVKGLNVPEKYLPVGGADEPTVIAANGAEDVREN